MEIKLNSSYSCITTKLEGISEGHRPPDPRGSPGISPKSGDGVGTGTDFENLRGQGGDGES